MSDGQTDHNHEALRHFKDWSNWLLVTTVASLGWVAQSEKFYWPYAISVALLCASVMFAIFTLALIPLVAEQLKPNQSIYDVEAGCQPLPRFRLITLKLKSVCWPQHVLFIAGIIAYAGGTIYYRMPS